MSRTIKYVPVIEKNVPIPIQRTRKGYNALLQKLSPGDSIWMPVTTGTGQSAGRRAFGKGNYAVRTESRELESGVRIWRTK